MEFTVEQHDLADGIGWVAPSLARHPTIPILTGARLDVDEALTITGYDHNTAARAVITATNTRAGSAVVPGGLFRDIVKALPSRPVHVAVERNRLELTGQDARFSLPVLPEADYPQTPRPPPAAGQVAADRFAEALSAVAPAVARDTTIPILTGVQCHATDDHLVLTATDRYRLSVRRIPWTPMSPAAAVVVPARSLTSMMHQLPGLDRLWVGLGDAPGVFSLSAPGRELTCRVLDGRLPQVVETGIEPYRRFADVEAAELAAALHRICAVTGRRATASFDVDIDRVVVAAGGGESAGVTQRIPAKAAGTRRLDFNAGYLSDGLAAVGATGTVRFDVDARNGRVRLSGESGPDECSYLIQPLRY